MSLRDHGPRSVRGFLTAVSGRRRRWLLMLAAGVLAVALYTLWPVPGRSRSSARNDATGAGEPPVAVVVAPAHTAT